MCPFPEIQDCAAAPGLIGAHFGPITLFCFSSSSFSFCLCPSLRLGAPLFHVPCLLTPVSCPGAWTPLEGPWDLACFGLVTKARLTLFLLCAQQIPGQRLGTAHWDPSPFLAWLQLSLGKSQDFFPCVITLAVPMGEACSPSEEGGRG